MNCKKEMTFCKPISRGPRPPEKDKPFIRFNVPWTLPMKATRLNMWDPYKRLGVSPYASEEELFGAHNFLLQQYAGEKRRINRSCF